MTQDELKRQLSYDQSSGLFVWQEPKHRSELVGRVAGTVSAYGYIAIRIGSRKYLAHRLAWLYVYGRSPSGLIDHINQNKTDNRIANLRDVSRGENLRNTGLRKTNKSGVRGVHNTKWGWKASIRHDGIAHHLGYYPTVEAAAAARWAMEEKLYSPIALANSRALASLHERTAA